MEEYCKILIVDDEYIMRRGIRYMMNWEEQGFQVVGEASNGKEALDMMKELKPHIVFSDMAMPVMDGIDFIKIAHRKYPDVQIIILSGYDKFDYVRQALLNGAVDYVLKPTLNPEILTKLLTKAVSRIPGMQLKKTFSSLESQLEKYLKGGEDKLRIQNFTERLPHSCYRLLGIPIRFSNSEGRDLSQIIFEKTEQYFSENASGNYLKFLYNPEFLCVVYNYSYRDRGKLEKELKDLMEQLLYIHQQTFMVLGREHGNLTELKQELENPEFLEAEMFYHKGEHIYEIKSIEEVNSLERFDFRRFSSMISQGKYIEAAELFQEYIYKAIESHMPGFKLKNQTKNLLYNFIGSVDRSIQRLEQIRYEYFAKIDKTVYVEEFRSVFEEMMTEILDCLGENPEIQDRKLKEMLDYILEHYREELDLSSLAETFNFNYSYLSTYFNTRMGEGFSEYLNRIRISNACRYLEKRELSMAAISEMVGYSDQSYFCRVFKRITGETPSAYRREHKVKEK